MPAISMAWHFITQSGGIWKNSLFYATDYSAYIASMLTSVIATCLHAGVNALEYLVALQEHRPAVFRDPAAWLPWNYHTHVAPP
jgi:hypothetical protein